jgi:hypothetical protein
MAQSKTATSRKLSQTAAASENQAVPLNFRVPQEFRKEFKIYAAQKGVPMNELVQQAFRALKEKERR